MVKVWKGMKNEPEYRVTLYLLIADRHETATKNF